MKLYSGKAISSESFTVPDGTLYRTFFELDRECNMYGKSYAQIYTKSPIKQGETRKLLPVGGKWKLVEV